MLLNFLTPLYQPGMKSLTVVPLPQLTNLSPNLTVYWIEASLSSQASQSSPNLCANTSEQTSSVLWSKYPKIC
eukprot:06340.XXX_164989_165207_1 [CDS] Oithona nana genome sequencing.